MVGVLRRREISTNRRIAAGHRGKIQALAPKARFREDVVYPMLQDIARPLAGSAELDPSALEASLRRHLRGEIRFDSGSRALYAPDGSNYRQVPIGVVVPRDKQDVI